MLYGKQPLLDAYQSQWKCERGPTAGIPVINNYLSFVTTVTWQSGWSHTGGGGGVLRIFHLSQFIDFNCSQDSALIDLK